MRYTKDEKLAVGSRLRAAREAAGLTLEQVGARFEVAKATVGHWETGQSLVDPLTLIHLCKVYRVDPVVVLLGDQRAQEFEGGPPTISGTLAQLARLLIDKDIESREAIRASVLRIIDEPESARRPVELVRLVFEEPELHLHQAHPVQANVDEWRRAAYSLANTYDDPQMIPVLEAFVERVDQLIAERQAETEKGGKASNSHRT